MRTASIERNTKETRIKAEINLDGTGKYNIETNCKFFKHMLEQFVYHSKFDLNIEAVSLDGDTHHLVEDTAIVIGSLLKEALCTKEGITRYGQFILPMDEALVLSVVDISGRAFSKIDVSLPSENVSDFETVLLPHFFNSLAQNAQITVHIKQLDGKDTHHIIEAVFKSFARALSCAVKLNNTSEIPSTKGSL